MSHPILQNQTYPGSGGFGGSGSWVSADLVPGPAAPDG